MNKFEEFHKKHPEVSLLCIAIESGINASLVRQYAVGLKNPSKIQLRKLQTGINEIGKELLKALYSMNQAAEQTHEEKVEMYMKSTKKELIEMLIECNRLLEMLNRPLL